MQPLLDVGLFVSDLTYFMLFVDYTTEKDLYV